MYKRLTEQEKQERKVARTFARRQAKMKEEVEKWKNQPEIKLLKISIVWKKSRTWGNCPRMYAEAITTDDRILRAESYASGYGYCKESTVIADAFNAFLRYKLYQVEDWKNKPYGIYNRSYEEINRRGFEGGVGTGCYYKIGEFIGGRFEHTYCGKSEDGYEWRVNNEE